MMINIAVLVSGGGTNLQALLEAQESGAIKSGKIALVLSSRQDAYALTRAQAYHVPSRVVERGAFSSLPEFEHGIEAAFIEYGIGLIVLAGFTHILSKEFVSKYERRIINVHPSLIPSFCGQGYYGLRVHEAALNYGVKISGATVHFVNEIPDGGEIILQKAVAVKSSDTPKTLQMRVMEQAEWKLLPKAVEIVCRQIKKTGEPK